MSEDGYQPPINTKWKLVNAHRTLEFLDELKKEREVASCAEDVKIRLQMRNGTTASVSGIDARKLTIEALDLRIADCKRQLHDWGILEV